MVINSAHLNLQMFSEFCYNNYYILPTIITNLHVSMCVAVWQDSSLPEGWEQRVTAEGRVYYVDHNTQSTSWEHPNSQKEDLGAMPPGWEVKQMADGRLFFVDHS